MGHGLRVPDDIEVWHRWQERRHPLRHARNRVRQLGPTAPLVFDLSWGGSDADICVVVDAGHASVAAALNEPLALLPPERVVLVQPHGLPVHHGFRVSSTPQPVAESELARTLRGVTTVLGSGHYTQAGAAVWAALPSARTFVSQHGAVTPYAPPLPSTTTVLAWTQADADFWRSGRRGIGAEVVGSQLLWRAGAVNSPDHVGSPAGSLTFLGQGHATEISRARLTHAVLNTCREHGAVYRPHPSERDIASRAVLKAYARAGIAVDTSGVPLVDLQAPIVSVFSTGVLEAAARGRDAWVDFPRPPAWLGEFWERYDMHRLGSSPTPAPPLTAQEPAQRIAEIVTAAAS